jgi:hypothetical protein
MANYNTYVKIESSVIPNIYVDDSFIDRFYTLNRVVRDGYFDEQFITEEKYKTVQDSYFRERNIQSVIYRKYYIKLFAKEETNLHLLKYADIVNITCQNGEIHQAKILTLSSEEVGGTKGLVYTISYADINPDNYNDGLQPVSNYLKSNTLVARFGTTNINSITFSGSVGSSGGIGLNINQTFYTILQGELINADLEENNQNLNGITLASRQISQKVIKMRFYLSELEAQTASMYMPMLLPTIINNGSNYTALERVIPNISKVNGVDLYQMDIQAKYQTVIKNNYV